MSQRVKASQYDACQSIDLGPGRFLQNNSNFYNYASNNEDEVVAFIKIGIPLKVISNKIQILS